MADGAVTSTLTAYGLLNQEANHNIYPAGLLAIIGEETSPSAASFSSRRQEDGIPDARLLDSIDLEWLCQQQSNLALHLMETKTKKHPNPVQGVVHIRKTVEAKFVPISSFTNNFISDIEHRMKVAHPSMLLHYLIPTRDSIKINQRNLEQDILLEIEVTVKAEDDLGLFVCPVCHNRMGMCQESRCKRPSLKAAKCHSLPRECAATFTLRVCGSSCPTAG